VSEYDRLRAEAITVQRRVLETLREEGRIGEDTYHRLEEELHCSELAVASTGQLELQDTWVAEDKLVLQFIALGKLLFQRFLISPSEPKIPPSHLYGVVDQGLQRIILY
jgi:hypothetical protein